MGFPDQYRNVTEAQPLWNRIGAFTACFVLSLGYLCLVISPAIELPYISGDDNVFFQFEDRSICTNNGFYLFGMVIGRVLWSLLYCQASKLIYQINDFSIFRAAGLVLTAMTMAGLTLTLRSLNLSRSTAFALSAGIFTLPGVLFFTLGGTGTFSAAPNFLLALAAHGLSEKITPSDMRTRLLKLRTILWSGVAIIMLVASANFYQGGICFFLVPMAAMVMFKEMNEWPDTRLRFLRDSILFITSSLTYFLSHNFIFLPIIFKQYPKALEYVSKGGYSMRLATDLLQRYEVFKIINYRSLPLWDIYLNPTFANGVLYFICLGLLSAVIAFVYRYFKSSDPAEWRRQFHYAIQATVAIILVIGMVNSVNMVAPNPLLVNRTLFPYQAIIMLGVFWAFRKIVAWLPVKHHQAIILAGAILIMMVGGILSQLMVSFNSINQYLTHVHVRARLTPLLDHLQAVHFIKLPVADYARTFTNTPVLMAVNDEFNTVAIAINIAEPVKALMLDHRDRLKGGVDGYGVVFLTDFAKEDEKSKKEWEKYVKDHSFIGTILTASKPGELVKAWTGAVVIDQSDFLAPPLADSESFYSHILTGGGRP